jgi:hypothetical protein
MATIGHKGVKLVYDDQGAGKPAFVFIHCPPLTRRSWIACSRS